MRKKMNGRIFILNAFIESPQTLSTLCPSQLSTTPFLFHPLTYSIFLLATSFNSENRLRFGSLTLHPNSSCLLGFLVLRKQMHFCFSLMYLRMFNKCVSRHNRNKLWESIKLKLYWSDQANSFIWFVCIIGVCICIEVQNVPLIFDSTILVNTYCRIVLHSRWSANRFQCAGHSDGEHEMRRERCTHWAKRSDKGEEKRKRNGSIGYDERRELQKREITSRSQTDFMFGGHKINMTKDHRIHRWLTQNMPPTNLIILNKFNASSVLGHFVKIAFSSPPMNVCIARADNSVRAHTHTYTKRDSIECRICEKR